MKDDAPAVAKLGQDDACLLREPGKPGAKLLLREAGKPAARWLAKAKLRSSEDWLFEN
jgi:hypothetical protein